jgi:hypothetical protein
MKSMLLTIVLAICMVQSALGQTTQPATKESYEPDDAYQIYSVLLPQQESYGSTHGTLVIQEEAVAMKVACLTPEANKRFKEAIASYEDLQKKTWLFQRRFQIEKPYEIVNSDTILMLLREGGWDGFYERYPDSGGYVVMSAVGFNKAKTLAIVYMGTSCGVQCGR